MHCSGNILWKSIINGYTCKYIDSFIQSIQNINTFSQSKLRGILYFCYVLLFMISRHTLRIINSSCFEFSHRPESKQYRQGL